MIRLDPFDRDEMMTAVGRRLTVFREVFKIGQKELGEAVGLSQPRYSLYETGKRRPTLENAIALCDAYDLTLDWIYRGDPSGLRYDTADAIKSLKAARVGDAKPKKSK